MHIELTNQTPLTNTAVGIDLGVNNFVALSNGELIASINAYEVSKKKIVSLQRRLAKQQKFSSNWNKTVAKLNKLHHKIANTRHDFINKLTTYLCKSHAIVVVEDLKIKNMTKSAKGTLEHPGKNVKAKAGLNRSILALGWGKFLRKLGCKLAWAGGTLIKVSPHFTSQCCSQCKHIAKENRKTLAKFCCIKCGHTQHADINAAINVLTTAGLAVEACGACAKSVVSFGMIDSMAMKQEPNRWPTLG